MRYSPFVCCLALAAACGKSPTDPGTKPPPAKPDTPVVSMKSPVANQFVTEDSVLVSLDITKGTAPYTCSISFDATALTGTGCLPFYYRTKFESEGGHSITPQVTDAKGITVKVTVNFTVHHLPPKVDKVLFGFPASSDYVVRCGDSTWTLADSLKRNLGMTDGIIVADQQLCERNADEIGYVDVALLKAIAFTLDRPADITYHGNLALGLNFISTDVSFYMQRLDTAVNTPDWRVSAFYQVNASSMRNNGGKVFPPLGNAPPVPGGIKYTLIPHVVFRVRPCLSSTNLRIDLTQVAVDYSYFEGNTRTSKTYNAPASTDKPITGKGLCHN